jgi:hypothetical protein
MNINLTQSTKKYLNSLFIATFLFSLMVVMTGCPSKSTTTPITSNNISPNANAGADQTITLPTNSVNLSGTGTDSDGSISSYAWSSVSGPASISFSSSTSASTTVNGLTVAGTYVIRLTVKDNKGASGTNDINIIVKPNLNVAPTSSAGADKSLTLPTSTTTLIGSGTDADGTIASYAWTSVSGPAAVSFGSGNAATTTVSGLTVAGIYVLRLTVTDNNDATASDDVSVFVNQPPTVSAGSDQLISLPTSSTTLTGSGTDADGTIASYAWSKVSGPSAISFGSASQASTSVSGLTVAGVYVFRLTITDNKGGISTDDINVLVNQSPAANAGIDKTIILPTTTTSLTGIGSDADGTIAAYAWSSVSGPSAIAFGTPSLANTTVFGLTEVGTYVIRLTVTDNRGAKTTNDVNIIVLPKPKPISNAGADQVITPPISSVTLLGVGTPSFNTGSILSYTWTFISGPAVASLTSSSTASTDVSGMNVKGDYLFKLTVLDDTNDSASDTVGIHVTEVPTADAGVDQYINLPVSTATLSGSGTDPDGTIVGYGWSLVSGPAAASITTPLAASTGVIGMSVGGNYVFRLTVTDNNTATGIDDMTVFVNKQPVPNAGIDQVLKSGVSTAILTGAGTDADGTVATYAWSFVSGPASPSITSPSTATTDITGMSAVGNYVFRLTLTDNQGAVGIDDVVVMVNQLPTANAGIDTILLSSVSQIQLIGSGTDLDGTISAYGWTFISGPAVAAIASPSLAATSMSGLIASGNYIFRLTVKDNVGDSSFDEVTVTVNSIPVINAGADQSITLPNSKTNLVSSATDQDGRVARYIWSSVSGPNPVTLAATNIASTGVWGMTLPGTYVFKIKIIDNKGDSAVDFVSVVVNAAKSPYSTLLPFNDSWKYNDLGNDLGTSWKDVVFDDALWKVGTAEFGYGDNPSTRLNFGLYDSLKYTTYYFRKVFNFDPSLYPLCKGVKLNLRRDDGAVVYLNGTEVYRTNIGTGVVNATTFASVALDDGSEFQTTILPISAFASGNNTIAVEIHQTTLVSTDITFDMELIGLSSANQTLLREPYLQMANSNSITVKWKTGVASDSKMEIGSTFGTYDMSFSDVTSSSDHELRITGLTPDTKYYYRYGSTDVSLDGDASNYFITAPSASVTRKIGVAVFGDPGTSDNGFKTNSISPYLKYVGANPADLMLALGNNAYETGSQEDYQLNFFNAAGNSILKNHVLYTAPGNHDYADSDLKLVDKDVPYYSIFNLPKNAESGGVASNSESYYSFDWGNIHFISLDSHGFELTSLRLYDTASPQVVWLKQDLAANTKKWTIVFLHHPLYTMGSRNSDTEQELISLRKNISPILERFGVDLVLSGHSHDYERSYLLNGYTGNEASFNVSVNALDSSSAKYDGTANSCVYQTVSGQSAHGTVYVVTGSAGGASDGIQLGYPHNAMPFSMYQGGMFYFEVEGNRLDAKFIRNDGVIADNFTIMKDVGVKSEVTIISGQSTTLTASWKGNYNWSTSSTQKSITVSPTTDSLYTCTDSYGCIIDSFTVKVTPLPPGMGTLPMPVENIESLKVYPVPVAKGELLHITTRKIEALDFVLVNISGQTVKRLKVQGNADISTSDLSPGLYILRVVGGGPNDFRKIMVMDRR